MPARIAMQPDQAALCWRVRKLAPFVLLLIFLSPVLQVDAAEGETRPTHEQQILEWRANRDASLRKEDGWLSLVGLEWLKPGLNTLGSAEENSAHIPGELAHWGEIELTDDGLVFRPRPGQGVMVDGVIVSEASLLADNSEQKPTVVRHGTISFHVIFRESYGLRISDTQAPARLNFKGVRNYPVDEQWLITGKLVPAEPGTTIEIGNVLGQLLDMPVFGYFEFEAGGQSHRLAALGEADSNSLWFIFADRTSGRETYGAGRFLYSEGMPSDGNLVVDFNKAYNPPCAFNDYSTCPLPPLENRLDLRVTAGEKDFHAIRSVH